jgi:catechol 2,3-dioxygenase-like lactoylglutathione lyase family enzyme
MRITELSHVNVTVPESLEAATKHFYGIVMGLPEVPKPTESKGRGGAWYQLGAVQLHLSREDPAIDNQASKRHVCYSVQNLVEAEQHFRDSGVEVLPDSLPVPGSPRFYVRDPGGNLIEIAQDPKDGHGDGETGRRGEGETGRHGDASRNEFISP